jgi:hypothetical protein
LLFIFVLSTLQLVKKKKKISFRLSKKVEVTGVIIGRPQVIEVGGGVLGVLRPVFCRNGKVNPLH